MVETTFALYQDSPRPKFWKPRDLVRKEKLTPTAKFERSPLNGTSKLKIGPSEAGFLMVQKHLFLNFGSRSNDLGVFVPTILLVITVVILGSSP